MSDSSKPQQQRSGATPIKNPLLSASVTGLTFDDFPNKPQLLPAAPPIVHAPVPPPSVTPSALLGREPKSLVTVGSSSLDTENLDEINLNASATEETTTNSSDANANLLWEQQQSSTSDSILSQAASSFSALPSVASNVFSSFSKRITGISSRETTPGYDTNSADSNGNNSNVPQLDIQPNYTQQQQHQQQFPQQQQQYQYTTPGQPLAPPPGQSSVPPAGQPFYAPPLPPSSGGYFESNLLPNTNLEASNIPPAEPPKFYTPAEVPSAPPTAAAVPPPSTGGGQNNFRFTAKKKLYAPIPGLSEQQSAQAAVFPPAATATPLPGAAIPPPLPYSASDPYSQPSPYPPSSEERKSEERKSGGGLFSKITQLAPSGVLQNITGLVQSAAGSITQTINPTGSSQNTGNYNASSSYATPPQGGNVGIQFDQQQQQQQCGVGYPLPPPPTTNYFAAPNYSGEPQANYTPPPPAIGEANPSITAVPAPPQAVGFFNPQTGNVPASGVFNTTAAPSPAIFDPFKQPPAASSTSTTPKPTQSRPPSQPGITSQTGQQPPQSVPAPAPSAVTFFNPLQAAPASDPSQAGVNFFNPSTAPPTIFDPFQQNPATTEPPRPPRPSSRPYNTFSEAVPEAGVVDQQQLRPASASNQVASEPPQQFFNPAERSSESASHPLPGGQSTTQQPPVQIFNPLLAPASVPSEAQQPPRPASNQTAAITSPSSSQVPTTSEQPSQPGSSSNPTPVQFFNPSTGVQEQPLRPASASNQSDKSASQVPACTTEQISQPATALGPVQFFNPLQAAFGTAQTGLPPSQVPSTTEQVVQPSPQPAVQFFNPLQITQAVNQPPSVQPSTVAGLQQPLRPPSATHPTAAAEQPAVTFFNPLQGAVSQPPQQLGTAAPPPANFFNPLQATTALPSQPVAFFDPSQSGPIAQPPPPAAGSSAALPPPPTGSTSFRLQKGTKLYKNPLTAQETAPAQVLPNPVFGVPPPTTSSGFPAGPQALPPQGQQFYPAYNPGFPGPGLTSIPNVFTPNSEAQSVPLFAPSSAEVPTAKQDSQQQAEPALIVPANQEVASEALEKSENPGGVPTPSQVPTQEVISEEVKPQEQQQESVNPNYFFKPIEPAAETQEHIETASELQEHSENSSVGPSEAEQEKSHQKENFFASNSESSQNFFNPIEPVKESSQIETTHPSDSLENTLQNLNLEPSNVAAPPVVPPPPTQLGPGTNNPYRRGSNASEANRPGAKVAPSLANFFTPSSAVAAGSGDFNFFASLPSQVDNSNAGANFFGGQTPEQQQQQQVAPEASIQAGHFFGNPEQQQQVAPDASNQAGHFFGTPASTTAPVSTESELKEPSAPLEEEVQSSQEPSTPYPPENTTGPAFPALPTHQTGVLPIACEALKEESKQETCPAPSGPIGFESFNPTASAQGTSTPNFFDTNQQQTTSQIAPPTGFENPNATPAAQQQTTEPSAGKNNNFSNFFNQSVASSVSVPQDNTCSSFFDNFGGQQQQQTFNTSTTTANQALANEEQRIQNFFNNPPPKDADHAGDLNYDLVHSGLAIRNLQQRSLLTPISNLVEPPSSACSEFSTLNASETSIVREDNKNPQLEVVPPPPTTTSTSSSSTTTTADASATKHYEELPEEILKELRMANLLQSDKPPTPVAGTSYKPAVKHWFYKRTLDAKQVWVPFSHYDSALLETSLSMEGEDKPEVVAVEGGRYDVYIKERLKRSVYWESEPIEVRRCSWFYKAVDSKYIPYEESTADVLESEYKQAAESGVWHKTIILGMGEQVVFHGPTVIVHFQQQQNQDAWGGTTQTTTRPRVVKRDLDDFNIAQGESQKVDHLLFMVHGIGSACDLKLRSVEEVVEDFRTIAHQLVQSHYKNSADLGLVGRVEVLPISWHSHLHSIELGIDEKLRSITLESIPKLRNFTNDTLLDILFYTSPTFCQRIMNSIVMSLNDIYMKYRQRHPDFSGGVSLAGHSLGSLILFDLLCHQNPIKESEEKNLENPDQQFLSQGNLATDSNQQLEAKSISYTMGPAGTGQPFINYGQLIFQPKKFFALGSPIGMFVTIRGIDKLGLDFRLPTCPGFYNIFHPYDPVAYRIEALVNPDLSGVRPVLIPHHKGRKRMHLELKETMARVSTDLKHRFLDKFKNTLDSVNFFGPLAKSKKETEEMMEKEVQKVIEMQMQMERQGSGGSQQPSQSQTPNQDHLSPGDEPQQSSSSSQQLPLPSHATQRARTDSVSTAISDDMVEIDFPLGKLNDSKRIDYVLQEAPLEFINEYIFALSSHVCYWDSEDTILFVMKEIYSGLGISPDSQVPQQTMTIERPSSRNSLSQS